MTKSLVLELLDLQKKGIEPFFSDEGAEEFWRLVCEIEEDEEIKLVG